jgi:hypothetical protein
MKSLRGELTEVKKENKFSLANSKMVHAIAESLYLDGSNTQCLEPVLINSLILIVSFTSKRYNWCV